MINQNPQNEKDTPSPRGMLKLKSLKSLVQSDVRPGSVQQSPQIVKRVSALPPGRSMKFEDYLARGFGTEEDFWQEEFVVILRTEVDAGLVRANEAAFFLGITSYLWQHGSRHNFNLARMRQPPSPWDAVKQADFLKFGRSKQCFWESSFASLVISGIEVGTLTIEQAADMLGVSAGELRKQTKKLKRDAENVIKVAMGSHGKSLDGGQRSLVKHLVGSGGERVVVEEGGSHQKINTGWITGEVVARMLRRCFYLKDQMKDEEVLHRVLKAGSPFYTSNVKRVVSEIADFCRKELVESTEVQKLLDAAHNLDCQSMEGGGYSLAPDYNYSKCMSDGKKNYWRVGLPALLLQDVSNGTVPAEVAAYQLGVTPTMIHCAVALLDADQLEGESEPAKKRSKGQYHQGQEQNESSGLISVRRYIELGFGTELSFWKEWSTLVSLQKVNS